MNETMILTTTVIAATAGGVLAGTLVMRLILSVTFQLVAAGRAHRTRRGFQEEAPGDPA